jgi:1-deoxy-D-xylulose-5-phosphate synthase
MVECCAVNPGHLGSSLGAVDLIVALHYIYNTPQDKIVFDVGHQAYAHKILTGRREAFKLNRKAGGISGFPKRDESPYDAFGAGHSSTSISAALGFAEAARLLGSGDKAIAVLGDGALTGGLAWEGLNNAGSSKADILVILNDNNISIDPNLGGVHEYLLKVTTHPVYNRLKNRVWNSMGEGKTREWVQKRVIDTKSNLVRSSGGAIFEALGFRYFGPIDGNDIEQLTATLSRLKNLHGPRLLHIHTRKGFGYAPAEENPTVWHAPGRFDPATGERIKTVYPASRYQDVFGQVLIELARQDPKVVGITPAMASGCGMAPFAAAFPDRFFDVGIEEGHAVTFSAGLAAAGMKPYCNIYSSFSQRAYDNIIHDVALQNLPVVFCFDRAGLVGEDGATHHGCFDLAAYRSIPGTVITAPRDERELRMAMYTGLQQDKGPFIIRYPRGMGEGVDWKDTPFELLPPGRGERLADGSRIAILTLGPFAYRALEAARTFAEEGGTAPAVYDLRYLKPLDEALLAEVADRFETILTVEDGALMGGLYGAVCEFVAGQGRNIRVQGLGIPDRFISQASQQEERHACGLDAEGILDQLRKLS